MTRTLYVFINVLVYWVLVTMMTGLEVGSFGPNFALLLGGLIFAFAAFLVEPILSFLKFPGNFWGFLVVGFILNLLVFVFFSTGLLPSVLVVKPGSLGDGFSPLPIPTIKLASSMLVAIVGSLVATLLQILVRKIAK